jgi:hypothetical protein
VATGPLKTPIAEPIGARRQQNAAAIKFNALGCPSPLAPRANQRLASVKSSAHVKLDAEYQ